MRLPYRSMSRNNANHRRSVAACSVEGVYFLELDRQANIRGRQEALAPPWYESFGFRLHTRLIDDVDNSIFGAIYEFTSPSNSNHLIITTNGTSTPRYIIAFRGTLIAGVWGLGTCLRDFQLDLNIIRNELHKVSRFQTALRYVANIVADYGHYSNIWLTGHSLGAAIAMLAGKTMAKEGIFLQTFLFNLPFVSAPIGRIKNEIVQHRVRTGRSFVAAGFNRAHKALHSHHHKQTNVSEDPLVALSEWVPHLYVHRGDQICSEYVGYFEHRKTMEKIGAGSVERSASQHSLRVLAKSIAKGKEREEMLHLIPSSYLVVNLTLFYLL